MPSVVKWSRVCTAWRTPDSSSYISASVCDTAAKEWSGIIGIFKGSGEARQLQVPITMSSSDVLE